MGKPSIFSRDYQKKMRMRKIKIAISAAVLIIIVIVGVLALKGKFNWSIKKPASVTTQKTEAPKVQNQVQQPPATAKEEGYDIKLSNGNTLKAVYETSGSGKAFKYLSPKDSGVFYNINPSGSKMVVFDKDKQNIILIDITGSTSDLTNPSYTSSSGTVVNKQEVLESNSSYIWCDSPMFLDDNNIAYITQLPWLSKSTKFIWMVNTESKTHTYVRGISGESVKFEGLEARGLKVNTDDSILYIAPNGEVSE